MSTSQAEAPTSAPVALRVSDSSLGQLGEFSGQWGHVSDEDLAHLLRTCRVLTISAAIVVFPGAIIGGWFGGILLTLGLLVFIGPGLALRALENERQTRQKKAAFERSIRAQVRESREMLENIATQIMDEEAASNRAKPRRK